MTNSGERFSADEIALVPLDELGRRLTIVLDRLGTRRNAAQIAERSVDQLAKYEKGKVEPPFSGLARLCLAAGVRMEWLATGEDPMLSLQEYSGVREPDPPPYRTDAPEPGGTEDRDQALLTSALRIVDDRLHAFGLRDHAKPDEFAELVRFVLADLKRGAAEDAASAALARVLNMTRAPHQP